MNPGETRPWEADDDAELGEALHHRLSQLAARLERLTSPRGANADIGGRSLSEAALASDAFADENDRAARSYPPPGYGRAPSPEIAAPPRQPGRHEKASLAEIAAALRDLDQPKAPPSRRDAQLDHASAEERLRSIRQRIDALKSRHAPEAMAEPPPAPEPRQRRISDFNAAIAEITARQRDIDRSVDHVDGLSATPRIDAAPPTQPSRDDTRLTDSIAALRRHVDDLSGAPRASAAEAELTRAPNPMDSASLAALNRQLDDIKAQLRSPSRPDLSAIEAGNAAIMERIGQLMARAPNTNLDDLAQQIAHRVPSSEQIDALSAEIDRLSERIAGLDQRGDLSRIEGQLASLEQLMAAGALAGSGQRLEAEMAGIRDAVETLSRMLHNGGSPAMARLEDRLNQISERFEATLRNAPRADTVTDLFERLETIAARGETAPAAVEALATEIAELRARERSELVSLDKHIQALAERLDDAILGQTKGGAAVADLEARLESLTRRLDELADAAPSADRFAELAQLEEQVSHLASRLDEIGAAGGNADNLAQLEAQVASLMGRLETLSSDHDALREVQANLTRLESTVTSATPQSLEAIQRAAKEAVQELSGIGGTKDAEMVEALRADLRELQAAARDNDRQTSDTIGNVHQTLDRVVARLGSLEADVRGRAPAAATASPPEPSRREAPVPPQATSPEPAPAAPPLNRRARRSQEEDKPLVPGSAGRWVEPGPTTDRDRRADFIAAARRAAQAAAAEHGAMQVAPSEVVADEEAEKDGALSRLGRGIAKHRRPLILAAAAIVLAIAAFQILSPIIGRSSTDETAPPAISAPATPEAGAAAPGGDAAPAEDEAAIVVEPGAADPPAALDIPAVPAPETALAPAANASPGAAAFIPPAGIVSPVNAPAAEGAARIVEEAAPPVEAMPPEAVAPAAEAAAVYPMPEEAIGAVRLRVAAAQGDPAALYEVGARYADGSAVTRDLAEAVVWVERAAEAGLAVAQHRLAAMYEAGLGVAENRPQALQWYTSAAEQGNVLAMHNLGVMYSQGVDGPPDFAAAIEWFTAAADHGIGDSQYNLGVIYARGIGTEADLVQSYKWFAIAAAQGDSDAAARRDDVAAALTPEELATARASVSAWTALGAPAEANTVDAPEGGWDAPEERVDTLDREELVRTIQELLAEHGFDPGPADGVEGPMTREAARAFQQTIGLHPTGLLDETLLLALTD